MNEKYYNDVSEAFDRAKKQALKLILDGKFEKIAVMERIDAESRLACAIITKPPKKAENGCRECRVDLN